MSVIEQIYVTTDSNVQDKPFGGTLNHWFPEKTFGVVVIHGILDKDNLGRFVDGTHVRTSRVEQFSYNTETKTGQITTRNTRYNLGAVRENVNVEKALMTHVEQLKSKTE